MMSAIMQPAVDSADARVLREIPEQPISGSSVCLLSEGTEVRRAPPHTELWSARRISVHPPRLGGQCIRLEAGYHSSAAIRKRMKDSNFNKNDNPRLQSPNSEN